MKKLLALILCVMLFVSVIPMAAFAADSTAASSGKVTADSIKAEIAKAIKEKNDAAKTLCENYDKAVKAWMENTENGLLALQSKAVNSILDNYKAQADKVLEASEKAYTEKLDELTKSIEAEIAKMFPAVASAS